MKRGRKEQSVHHKKQTKRRLTRFVAAPAGAAVIATLVLAAACSGPLPKTSEVAESLW
jgi:hypothetical protein